LTEKSLDLEIARTNISRARRFASNPHPPLDRFAEMAACLLVQFAIGKRRFLFSAA